MSETVLRLASLQSWLSLSYGRFQVGSLFIYFFPSAFKVEEIIFGPFLLNLVYDLLVLFVDGALS